MNEKIVATIIVVAGLGLGVILGLSLSKIGIARRTTISSTIVPLTPPTVHLMVTPPTTPPHMRPPTTLPGNK